MSFAAQRAAAFYATQLNVDVQAEWCEYRRPGLAPLPLVATIDAEEKIGDGPLVEEHQERIVVTVGRDPAHTKGGIATPRLGDALVRDSDPATLPPYAYTGEIRESTPHSFTLIYARHNPFRTKAS